MGKGPHTKLGQVLLGDGHHPQVREPRQHHHCDHEHRRDGRGHHHHLHLHAVGAKHTAVQYLLDQYRHHYPATSTEQRQHDGDAQPAQQSRTGAHCPAQHRHRPTLAVSPPSAGTRVTLGVVVLVDHGGDIIGGAGMIHRRQFPSCRIRAVGHHAIVHPAIGGDVVGGPVNPAVAGHGWLPSPS